MTLETQNPELENAKEQSVLIEHRLTSTSADKALAEIVSLHPSEGNSALRWSEMCPVDKAQAVRTSGSRGRHYALVQSHDPTHEL